MSIVIFLVIVMLLLLYGEFRPYIDRTSNGSVVIWFNYKDKRIFKYLWKKEN
jgi:hypothetical protein